MSNIAEGFERDNPAEFHQFLVIARASCAEVRLQLYIALDVGYITKDDFDRLITQAEEVAQIVSGLRTYIAGKRHEKK